MHDIGPHTIAVLTDESIALLQQLVEIPSYSREESETAAWIADFLDQKGIRYHQKGNNIWAYNEHFDPAKPSILLNSHHDTVKPGKAWTKDPFYPEISDGKLYGLGSNDAGGCLVSLLATFRAYYHQKSLNYNLIYAATAEEEISGTNGIESILPELGIIEFGIVGEPTQMEMAVAEKGLLVLDCVAHGKTGHAARDEGENAIYKAIKDIEWFQGYQFDKISPFLGAIKMAVTVIKAGEQHNVVPDICNFTVDIRLTEEYTHKEILETISAHVQSDIIPRSTRIKPSTIALDHPIVKAGLALGRQTFGSPTTSDQAFMDFPTLKIGPGDSARSHTPDEFIFIQEIRQGIEWYIAMLNPIMKNA